MNLDMSTFRQALAKAGAAIEKTVQSTVQEVTGPKPLQDYELLDQVGSGGPGLIWKLYSGRPRNKAMQIHNPEVCVWVLDKKSLVDLRLRAGISKAAEDAFLDVVRADAAQLMRLRHPGVVRVIQGLDESKGAMAMVTEPIFASIANVLGRLENVGNIPKDLKNLELGQLEIKHGLLQLAETLGFLHNNAHLIHRGISPEAVYITASGAWKFAGFGFAVSVEQSLDDGSSGQAFHYPDYDVEENVMPLQPLLEYAAPEITRGHGSSSRTSTDIFSLACVSYHLLTQRSLLQCNNNLRTYTSNVTYLSSESFSNVPPELVQDLRRMLNPDELARPSAMDFTSSPFFRDDTRLRALRFLDHMLERDNMQKSGFLKALGDMWTGFDARVLRYKVLPPLCAELRNEVMQPMVLPMVLTIAEAQDKNDFVLSTLPSLLPVLSSAHGDTLLLLVKHAGLLINKVGGELLTSSVMPMLVRAYDDPDARMQEEVLRRTLAVTKQLDFQMLKTAILPRVHALALKTTVAAVRVNALLCLGELVQRLDKPAVIEVLGTLQRCTAVDHTAPTLMCTLGVASAIYKQFGVEFSAEHLLPLLCPLLIAQQLNLHQFAKYMHFMKEILRKIEEKRGLTVAEVEPVTLDVSTMALGSTNSGETKASANGGQKKGGSAWDSEDWEAVTKGKQVSTTTAPSQSKLNSVAKVSASAAAAFPNVSLSTSLVPNVPVPEIPTQKGISEPSLEWPPRQSTPIASGSKVPVEQPSMAYNPDSYGTPSVSTPDDFDPFADWPPRPSSASAAVSSNPHTTTSTASQKGDARVTSWSSGIGGPPMRDAYTNNATLNLPDWSSGGGGLPMNSMYSNNAPLTLPDWSSPPTQSKAQHSSASEFGDFFASGQQPKADPPPRKLAPPPPSGLGKGQGRNPIRGIGTAQSKPGARDQPNILDLL